MEVLQELGDADGQWGTPSWLCWRAGLDPGYLSRILKRFREEFLEDLPERQQRRLVHAMEVIEEVVTRSPLENLFEKYSIKSFSAG